MPGSRVCSWPEALIIRVPSCRQTGVSVIHGSCIMSSNVALFLGSTSSILAMIALLSLGSRRNKRQGPLMTSGFEELGTCGAGVGVNTGSACGSNLWRLSSTAGFASSVGFGLPSNDRLETASACGVTGLGADTKSLYDVSERRGIFQGNRRRDMHAKIIAKDQTSTGCGSYLLLSYTSGAK